MSTLFLASALAAPWLLAGDPAPAPQRYNLVELGAFVPDARESTALDLNERGQVVGQLVYGDERRVLGFVWEHGTVRRLVPQPHDPATWPPTLTDPFHQVGPVAINDLGLVAGTAVENAGWTVASGFFADASAGEFAPLHAIHSLDPFLRLSVADVSSSIPCRFVGTGEFVDLTTLQHRRRAFVTRLYPDIGKNDMALVELGTFGGLDSIGEAVNSQGVIVGGATDVGGFLRAFRSRDGAALEDLGTLGGRASQALDVSESGVIVGWAEVEPGLEHAFRHENGVMTDLGTLGGQWSRALGVDPSGTVVVGASLDGSGRMRACLWRDGAAVALDALVPASLGWSLREACAVNSSGWIVGHGRRPDGSEHAFLLEPAGADLAPLAPGRAGVVNDLTLTEATPGATVAFLYGDDAPGYLWLPSRAAGGLLLSNPIVIGFARADGNGAAHLSVAIPPEAALRAYRMQALQLDRFVPSDLELGVIH